MKTYFRVLMMSILLSCSAEAQLIGSSPPGGGNLEPPGTGVLNPNVGPAVTQPVVELPPPVNQVGDPSVTTGGPGTVILTNRGHIISDTVNTDDLHIDVTLVFPTNVLVDVSYRDYIDIVIAATGGNGVQQNRPWGVVEPGTIIIRVLHGTIYVIFIGPDGPDGDSDPDQIILSSTPINTADGNLPLEVDILIHDGVIDVATGGQGGAGGDPLVVDLPPGTNTSGNVIIYNREPVAGVDFEAEISNLTVIGTDPTPPTPPIAP